MRCALVAGGLDDISHGKWQTIAVSSTETPQALIDRLTMRQALINLLDNAIKFTPAGGRIEVRIAEPAGHLVIDVVDSGPGISPEARARIFDRFYRATSETSGSGLGLSIAKGAVDANGGRLTVEASGPGGTTFRITLPRGSRQ